MTAGEGISPTCGRALGVTRAFAALLASLPLLGCVAPDEAAGPAPPVDARVTSLTVAPACAPRGTPLSIRLTVENPEARNGTAKLLVHAQQYGNLVDEAVALGPRETRDLSFTGTLDTAGRWTVFAEGPRVEAGQTVVVATDPDAPDGPRC